MTTTSTDDLDTLAQQFGFSRAAVRTMQDAVRRGNGSMAQFAHDEFGGAGQWMRGGMTMTGDMFNHALKDRVSGLAEALAQRLQASPRGAGSATDADTSHDHAEPTAAAPASPRSAWDRPAQPTQHAAPSGNWWPANLGAPNSTGSQNDVRYAYFGDAHRLAIDMGGKVTVYDTGTHRIGGVSQQQSSGYSLKFSSDQGDVDLATLPVVSTAG